MMKGHWATKFKRTPAADRTLDGIVFDSKREMHHYAGLKMRVEDGQITALELQPKYPLQFPARDGRDVAIRTPTGRVMIYTPDFRYMENGKLVVVEVKGFMQKDAQIRIAVFEAIYGLKVKIVR